MKYGKTLRKRLDGGKAFQPKPKKYGNEPKPERPEKGGWAALKRRIEREDKP